MAVLPRGFALPPPTYLLALAVGLAIVGWGLHRRRPALDERRTLALAPWMVAGAAAHVLHVVEALPTTLQPLTGTPSVYVVTAIVAGAVWLAADARGTDAARALAGVGVVAALAVLSAAAAVVLERGSVRLDWPLVGLLAGVVAGIAAWYVLVRFRPEVRATGRVGALAVLGHALDGVSTAVGVDALGFGERTPLARAILEFAAGLPTAEAIGAGWAFVLVKVALACAIVYLLTDYVRDRPGEGYALLAVVAAVGLGPGVHNLLLFAIA